MCKVIIIIIIAILVFVAGYEVHKRTSDYTDYLEIDEWLLITTMREKEHEGYVFESLNMKYRPPVKFYVNNGEFDKDVAFIAERRRDTTKEERYIYTDKDQIGIWCKK